MFQLYKYIQTDFVGQIFLELFQFKTRSLFGTPSIIKYISSNSTLQCNLIEGRFIYKVTGALGVTTTIPVHWRVRNKNYEN